MNYVKLTIELSTMMEKKIMEIGNFLTWNTSLLAQSINLNEMFIGFYNNNMNNRLMLLLARLGANIT